MQLTARTLIGACADDSEEAGLLLAAELEPIAGPGSPVKPASYAGRAQGDPPRHQIDKRWSEDRPVDVAVIDNVPSQAGRHEAQLDALAATLGIPSLVLDLAGLTLPEHLPSSISVFRFAHRHADAYLRDAELDGMAFLKTPIGRALVQGTDVNAEPLMQWVPQSLLYGFWMSHLGKKGSQAKLARSWVSEIVGWEPAALDTVMLGVKGDPLNLTTTDKVLYDENDTAGWTLTEGEKKSTAAKGKKQEKLSEIGHGQVPTESGIAALSFRRITQRATVSFAGLRRLHFGMPERNAAGRAVLVALGLVGHTAAFGRSFSLRSGCDLRPTSQAWTWLGAASDEAVDPLAPAGARALFAEVVAAAEATGLPVGGAWRAEPVVLTPNPSLRAAIVATYPGAE
jgi:CRISPR-associated protein Csb1